MAESESRLPAALWAIPAPLVVVAAFAILAFVGLQGPRSSPQAGDQTVAEPRPSATAGRSSDATDIPPSPAVELLRRYLNEVKRDGTSRAASSGEPPFSARATIPRDSPAAAAIGFSEAEFSLRLADAPKTPADAADAELWQRRRELQGLRDRHPFWMQCLVATLPDPIDSHLQLTFDSGLAAITRAFEQHGYVFDRFSLPWSDELRDRPLTGRPNVQKYRQPGAVLFRKAREAHEFIEGDTCDLIMLLLVGETPTGGIRGRSLCAALDFVAAWDLVAPAGSHQLSIRLLGPTFSGSSPSLRWSVFEWRKTRRLLPYTGIEVDIVSGSATADSNRNILTVPCDPTRVGEDDWPPLNMQFHSTVIRDKVTMQRLLRHLVEERGIKADAITLLVEGNTSYGRELVGMRDKTGNQGARGQDHLKDVLFLPFPMALSRIRSEYEKSEAYRMESQRVMARVPRSNLKLPLEPPPYVTDVLPTFAAGTSAVTDLSLEQILATISRRHIRAVGILGTDVLDKLFLAQQVRLHARDVQLFTIEADLLYAHADYAHYLSGTLIASTYPLFTHNQGWTRNVNDRKELQFPADTAEGIYNATILLLNRLHPANKPQPLLDYSYPFADRSGIQGRPPLWLTMASESGLWPVKAIPLDEDETDNMAVLSSDEVAPQATAPTFRFDPPSPVPAYVASLMCVVFVFVFWVVNCRGSPPAGAPDPQATCLSRCIARIRVSCRWLELAGAASASTTRRLLTVACFLLSLLSVQAILTSPTFVFTYFISAPNSLSERWSSSWWWASLVSLVVGAVLLWLLLAVVFRALFTLLDFALSSTVSSPRVLLLSLRFRAVFAPLCYGYPTSLPSQRLVVALVRIATAITVGIVVWSLLPGSHLMCAEQRTQAAVFVERIGTLSSGVTWLVPAALLAGIFGCWVACQLWRFHLLDICPLADPFGRSGPAPVGCRPSEPESVQTAGFSNRVGELDARLESAWFLPATPVDWLFLLLLAVGLVYVFGARWIGTAEGGTFDCVFRCAACAAIVLIGWSQVHVKAVGGLFERLLRRMAQHAIVSAFDRVPDRLAAKVAGQVFAASPHPGDLDQPVRCLTHLANEASEWWPESLREVETVQDKFAALLDRDRGEKGDVDRTAAALNTLFAGIAARQLVPRLIDYWDREDLLCKREQGMKDNAASSPASWEEQAELFLAMHFVNLIRQVFSHIKSQLTFLVLMLLCLLGCFHAYPFQPGGLIMRLCYGLTIWCLVTNVLLIIRFNRCEVLSRLSKTTPNRFTFDRSLVLPMITYVLIPLFSLLAVQFPGIGRMLFTWLDAFRHSLPT
jgi:hypothetical protein